MNPDAPHAAKQVAPAFDPANPAYRRRLWVRLRTTHGVFHHVFWRRIATVLLVLALLGWLAGSVALWSVLKFHRGHDTVRWVDVAFYPWRATQYRTNLGRHYLARGTEELERKNYRTGNALLLAGLARVPDDYPARRLVAFTQIRLGRTDHALNTLTDSAALARADLDYLKLTFGLLLETQLDDRAIALARALLPATPDTSLTHRFMALQAATAHYHRGRYAEAEEFVAAWQLVDSLEGQILLARCDWERGRPEAALDRLIAQLARFSSRDELHVELVRFYRDSGRPAEARRHALLRRLHFPATPGPRIDLLHACRDNGDREAETRELAVFFQDFGGDAGALVLLAWFAVDTQQPELAWRIRTEAQRRGFPLAAHDLACTQAALVARDYRVALDRAEVMLREKGEVDWQFFSALNGLRSVALFALGDREGARAWLGSFLQQTHSRSADALVLARELIAVGASADAREVLEHAARRDPHDPRVLAALVQMDLDEGAREKLTANLPTLLATRKPSRFVLTAALLRLDQPVDAPLREQIRTALAHTSKL